LIDLSYWTVEQSGEREPPMTRVLKSRFLGGGPVTASVIGIPTNDAGTRRSPMETVHMIRPRQTEHVYAKIESRPSSPNHATMPYPFSLAPNTPQRPLSFATTQTPSASNRR
jgi:hypothetical protein